MIRWLLAWLVMAVAVAAPAQADEFRPSYLLIEQTAPERYDILWKVPALDEATRLAVRPIFPAQASSLGPVRSTYSQGATVSRWSIRVSGGLDGKTVRIDNLSRSGLDALIRYRAMDGTEQVARVDGVRPDFTVNPRAGGMEVALSYTRIGIEHILEGFDHLLFVLALVLMVRDTRRLIVTATAFTIAHSITLALATLGVIRVPGPPVEAIIALSIVFVAQEIIRTRNGQPGLAARKPWIVAFAFGLLHGLGFAGALAEVGLPANAIPLALLFFNVGVELGQLLFIAATLALIGIGRRLVRDQATQQFALTAATYAIGGIACFWLFERVWQFG